MFFLDPLLSILSLTIVTPLPSHEDFVEMNFTKKCAINHLIFLFIGHELVFPGEKYRLHNFVLAESQQ